MPPSPEAAAKGARLVRTSRILLAVGVLTMAAGCGTGIALRNGIPAFGGIGLGFLLVVAAAVVGQIGRGFQGRVV